MLHLIIRFPFSSVNDEQYMLALCLHHPTSLQTALDALDADSEVFTQNLTITNNGDTIYNYTGTLQGTIQVADDERVDIFEPIVAAKLSFNMACQTFPEWLMEYCNMRWVSVLLYKDNPRSNVELWRGYLIAQSLNMTVVDNLMACSMTAVDEIGMAKYMSVKDNFTNAQHWCTLHDLLQFYHDFHYFQGFTVNGINGVGFSRYYSLLGLTDNFLNLLWKRDMVVDDGDGNEIDGIPWRVIVNLDKWMVDSTATFGDVFDAVFRYLCVTISMGSWGESTQLANDSYLLTCPSDMGNINLYGCHFGQQPSVLSSNVFITLTNPTKIGGDLQVSTEPMKYKSVTVESEPTRWETHNYLDKDSYTRLGNGVKRAWGQTNDPDNGPFLEGTYRIRKMRYLRLDDKEADFVTIPDCEDGEGFTMAQNNELPYDDINSCTSLTHPTTEVADSLDFITFKEGAVAVELGNFMFDGVDEDEKMTPYFMLLNHMWENRWNEKSYQMAGTHLYDTKFLIFTPFGNMAALHPVDSHYLKLSMQLTFIRENFGTKTHPDGDPGLWLWQASPGVGHTMRAVNWTNTTILMPTTSSAYDKFSDSGAFSGNLQPGASLDVRVIIRVGDRYFNGSSWLHQPQTIPTCELKLKCTSLSVTTGLYGTHVQQIKNYYYEAVMPWEGSQLSELSDRTSSFYNLANLSSPNQPFEGKLEVAILGQIDFQNSVSGVHNSVPFVLVNGVEISYTDDAELANTSMAVKNKIYMDYYAKSKQDMVRKLELATPSKAGFFSNVLLCDVGKAYQNIMQTSAQGGNTLETPEHMLASKLAAQYADDQCFVELSTPIRYDHNVHNVDFKVQGLTEVDGVFLPLRRTFDYRYERMRVKLMRVNGL